MVSIFNYFDYKSYLEDFLKENKAFKRKTIAELIRVQTAFVSQVLNGHLNFSLEQAEMLSRGMGHTAQQTKYFLAMISYERAGTKELKEICRQELEELKDKFTKVTARMRDAEQLTLEQQSKYYSSWHYQAIHMLTTIKEFQKPQDIAKRLSLDLGIVNEILEFLSECRIVGEEKGRFKPLTIRTHVSKDSPLSRLNHSIFRNKALLSLSQEEKTDLHYTSVFTASRSDIEKIKEMLLQNMEEINKVIAPSPEEELFNLCIDYYRLK